MAYTTIDKPSDYFETVLYTGNGGTQSITSLDFQPDWCWFKDRSGTNNHALYDSVRGATKMVSSNNTNAQSTNDGLTSFNSNGFTLGNVNKTNTGSTNYAAWNWKESATAGFDIVSYTGNSSDGVTQQNISHSLSAVPQVIIIKNRADATNWCVYHHKNTSAPETEIIYLNLTNATSDDSAFFGDTAPTSSIFTVGGDNGVNGNGDSMIAYCFAEKKGYSKFGIYTGNGASSANSGTFVYTGFKPSLVIVKNTDTEGWQMWDNKRSSYNGQGSNISPNSSNAESTGVRVHFFSNGYQLVSSGADQNSSGATFIYMAFAESPFVTSSGVPACAR
jgi:hypothetical protein